MSPYNRPSVTDNCLYQLSQFLESYTADMKFYQDFRYTVPLFSTLCAAPGNWQLKHLDLGRSSNPHQCTSAKHLLFRVLTCELRLLQNIWVDPASDIVGFPKRLWIAGSVKELAWQALQLCLFRALSNWPWYTTDSIIAFKGGSFELNVQCASLMV